MPKATRTKAPRARKPAKPVEVSLPAVVETPETRYGEVQDRYEAAYYPAFGRSWIWEGVQDVERDIDPYTRTELLRQARYFEKNDPIVRKLVALFCNYVFGPAGLRMVPNTSDDDFNEAAAEWFHTWGKHPDYCNKLHLTSLQHVIARRWMVDGEVWIYKTTDPKTKQPRVQLIEAHRIGNPGTDRADNGNFISDGVELDSNGIPVAYYVAQKDRTYLQMPYPGYVPSGFVTGSSYTVAQAGSYNRVLAENMIHLYEPERAGQLRGISMFYPCIRLIHDLWDLRKLEMVSAKVTAESSVYITNASGTANTAGMRRANLAISTQNAANTTVQKQQVIMYDQTYGGRERYLKTGETVQFPTSNRPSPAVQWFYEDICKKICLGVGISPLLVSAWSLQGTVTRAELQTMTTYFRSKSAIAAAALTEVYEWVMGWGVKFDRALDGAPDDFAKVTVRPPRGVDVDVGRNSQALIAEYSAGFRTLKSICAELGEDWRTTVQEKAQEAAYIKQCAEANGVTVEDIQTLIGKPSEPADKEQEPEPEPVAA
jgi:lambda family phage portal protein